MKLKRISLSTLAKIQSNMTSMIDVVFLLLIFFILTFRIVEEEHEFALAMPLKSGKESLLVAVESVVVRLYSGDEGQLSGIDLNGTALNPKHDQKLTDLLHLRIRDIVSDPLNADHEFEVRFQCDFDLKYAHLIAAMTAVSGYRAGPDRDSVVVPLAKKVQFLPAVEHD